MVGWAIWRSVVKYLLSALALFLTLGVAQAHTHLKSSTPADQAVLTAAPKQIVLRFSEPTRLTAVTVQKDGDKNETTLSELPKEAAVEVTLPVEIAASGAYKLSWRAVGPDSHIMSGSIRFTVK
jgi:copper resistance protein C